MWKTGPCRHRCGHLARFPLISLRQGARCARLPLVPSREARRDAARGLAVAAAARLRIRAHGELSCLSRLFVRGVRQRAELLPPCGLCNRLLRHGKLQARGAARVARHPTVPRWNFGALHLLDPRISPRHLGRQAHLPVVGARLPRP